MLQLIFYCDNCAPFGKADAKQPGQFRDHKGSFLIPLILHHPDDGIQRIIQKMRINLALQSIQLTFPAFILL